MEGPKRDLGIDMEAVGSDENPSGGSMSEEEDSAMMPQGELPQPQMHPYQMPPGVVAPPYGPQTAYSPYPPHMAQYFPAPYGAFYPRAAVPYPTAVPPPQSPYDYAGRPMTDPHASVMPGPRMPASILEEPMATYASAAVAPSRLPAHKPVRLTQPKHPLAPPGTPVFFKYGEEHYPEETIPDEFTYTESDGTICRYITNFLVYNKRGERLLPILLDQPRNTALVLYGSLLPAALMAPTHSSNADKGNSPGGETEGEDGGKGKGAGRGAGAARTRGRRSAGPRSEGTGRGRRAGRDGYDDKGGKDKTMQTYPVRVELLDWCIDYGQEPSNVPFIWLISKWDIYYRLEKPAGRYIPTFSLAKLKFEVATRIIKSLQFNPMAKYEEIVSSVTAAHRLEKMKQRQQRKADLRRQRRLQKRMIKQQQQQGVRQNTAADGTAGDGPGAPCAAVSHPQVPPQDMPGGGMAMMQAPPPHLQGVPPHMMPPNMSFRAPMPGAYVVAVNGSLHALPPMPVGFESEGLSPRRRDDYKGMDSLGLVPTRKKNRNWKVHSLSTPEGTGVFIEIDGRPGALTPWGAPYAVEGCKEETLLQLAEFLDFQIRNFMEGVGANSQTNLLETPFMTVLRHKAAVRRERMHMLEEAKQRAMEVAGAPAAAMAEAEVAALLRQLNQSDLDHSESTDEETENSGTDSDASGSSQDEGGGKRTRGRRAEATAAPGSGKASARGRRGGRMRGVGRPMLKSDRQSTSKDEEDEDFLPAGTTTKRERITTRGSAASALEHGPMSAGSEDGGRSSGEEGKKEEDTPAPNEMKDEESVAIDDAAPVVDASKEDSTEESLPADVLGGQGGAAEEQPIGDDDDDDGGEDYEIGAAEEAQPKRTLRSNRPSNQ